MCNRAKEVAATGSKVTVVDLRHAYLQIHLNGQEDQTFSDSTDWLSSMVSHAARFRSDYDFAGDEDGDPSGDENGDPSDLGTRRFRDRTGLPYVHDLLVNVDIVSTERTCW